MGLQATKISLHLCHFGRQLSWYVILHLRHHRTASYLFCCFLLRAFETVGVLMCTSLCQFMKPGVVTENCCKHYLEFCLSVNDLTSSLARVTASYLDICYLLSSHWRVSGILMRKMIVMFRLPCLLLLEFSDICLGFASVVHCSIGIGRRFGRCKRQTRRGESFMRVTTYCYDSCTCM